MKKKSLTRLNKIVRGSTYTISGLIIVNFYGWFLAEIFTKLFV